MKALTILGILALLAMGLALATSPVVAISVPAPGGTPGAPGGQGGGQPSGGASQNTPGAQATARAETAPVFKGKPMLYRGTITAVDATSLTALLGDGTSVTVGITPDTRILIPGKKSQADSLMTGMQVVVWAFPDVNGNPVARAIIAIPGKPTIVHRVGTVTEYTPGISITILAVDGNTYPFTLTADTRILPADRAVELAVGSRVTVIAPRDPGALSWTATGIVVHPATSQ